MTNELSAEAKKNAAIYLQNLIVHLPGHIFWEDVHGQFLGCNDQHAKSVGLNKASDLVGKTLWEMGEMLGWDDKMIEQLRRNDVAVIQTGEPLRVTEKVIWADGAEKTFLSQKTPMVDDEGNCIGIMGMAFDITDRIEIENQLVEAKEKAEAANQAKSDFIANMSHDLRTPLHAILGSAELLKIQSASPEQIEHLEVIMQAGKMLSSLIENILDFSVLEQDKKAPVEEPINLFELIQQAVAVILPQAQSKGISVNIDYSPDLPKELLSNADAMTRILTNLVGNAIKFTDAGQISVVVKRAHNNVNSMVFNIMVKDSGIGISQEDLPHVFERFYRVSPSYKGKYKGTGLGLAITKKLVNSLGGKIAVYSELHVGSTFVCTLPFKRFVLNTPRSRTNSANDGAKKTSVLLVEDSALIQKFSVEMLKTLGCQTTVASTAHEALLLGREFYDLIFIDLGLPDGDALEVIRELRKDPQHQKTPIIVLTGHATDQIRQNCLAAGVTEFLVKPASYKMFEEFVKKYTNRSI